MSRCARLSRDEAVTTAKLWGGRAARARKPKVRVGSDHQLLVSYVRAHCRQFPSEARLDAARRHRPLPSMRCRCEGCFGKVQGWPVGYVWEVSGPHAGMSYECGLHAQTDEFLAALPHSSSIAVFASELFP